jgi:hypothetical protein
VLYTIGTDGKVYRFIIGTDTNWTQWLAPTIGKFTFLSYGDVTNVWAVHQYSSRYGPVIRAARFAEWALAVDHYFNATTICEGTCPNQSSNPPVYHTTTSHFVYKVNGAVAASSNTATSGHVNPTDQVALHTSLGVTGDSFFTCFINPGDCVIETDSEGYDCSEEGTLVDDNGAGGPPLFEIAHLVGHVQYTGPLPAPSWPQAGAGPGESYNYGYSPVPPECSNTTNPAVKPSFVVGTGAWDEGFDVSAGCWSILGSSWVCIYPIPPDGVGPGGVSADKEYVVDPPTNYCDPNR